MFPTGCHFLGQGQCAAVGLPQLHLEKTLGADAICPDLSGAGVEQAAFPLRSLWSDFSHEICAEG